MTASVPLTAAGLRTDPEFPWGCAGKRTQTLAACVSSGSVTAADVLISKPEEVDKGGSFSFFYFFLPTVKDLQVVQ